MKHLFSGNEVTGSQGLQDLEGEKQNRQAFTGSEFIPKNNF
jgi:hypothetical protein